MQRIKNPSYVNKGLKIGAKRYEADEHGVFDVPDNVATVLLSMKGFFVPRITKEVQAAEDELRVARRQFAKAESRLDVATLELQRAQVEADQGRGTPLDAPEKPEEAEEDPEDLEDEDEVEEGSEGEDDDEEGEELDDPAEIIEEMKAAGKGEDPSMRWTLDALIRYCHAVGVEADSSWSKSQCIQELEANEE